MIGTEQDGGGGAPWRAAHVFVDRLPLVCFLPVHKQAAHRHAAHRTVIVLLGQGQALLLSAATPT